MAQPSISRSSSPATGTPSANLSPSPGVACSIARTLEVIGDRWTILILRSVFRGVRRFDALQADCGIARNLLADRLHRLVEHDVLAKVQYNDRPARYEYRLTAKGIDLSPALVALMRWGDRWMSTESVDTAPPVELVHNSCGHVVDQIFVCWECDETVGPLSIRSKHQQENSEGIAS